MNRINFLLTIIAVILLFLPVFKTSAQVIETPFGGEIIRAIPCTCSLSTMLMIKNYDGKQLRLNYIPGFSIIYMSYNYLGATYLLGTYSKLMRNMCYTGGDCELFPDDGALGAMPGTGFSQ